MPHLTIGHRLPHALAAPLFGDRTRFGLAVQPDDPCWKAWTETSLRFYDANQKRSIGRVVNDAGYRVMRTVDLAGKHVLEIGPGNLEHGRWWRGRPARYVVCDISESMLDRARGQLVEADVPHECRLVERSDDRLPFDDASFDLVVSFYTLEHLNPLRAFLEDQVRVLRPGGIFAGAIPAEGGLGWGIGRWLTTRRWLKRHTAIDPDKIICWEHPNFAGDILRELDTRLRRRRLRYWPLGVPSIDLNLVVRFEYEKPGVRVAEAATQTPG